MISIQQLYQQSLDKTRVVIVVPTIENNIMAMLRHVLEYHDKDVDYVLPNGKSISTEDNEFVLIEATKNANDFKANIALIVDVNPELNTTTFIDSITDGGMLVYNQDVASLKLIVEANTHTIKKYSYAAPNYTIENELHFLETNEGKLPIQISEKIDLENLFGIKWLCQHLGIDEDAFYEAIGTFEA
ncbi:hypothetical protein EGM88_13170 [Aureibaculum marinum]|uniref:Uncharacterized protein n=1 Tax=Aureibaculum marinum TaxID=2487930 RepID=A0A3N4NFC3_9FLAO|nr:hypothetical protein [Aureibaculum marinum]RPD93448.1 hypothetical protein EGM88_13170 [Aureibaculum marinum]